jgi:hypothetical protein
MAKIVPARVQPLPPRKMPERMALQLFALFGAPAAWSLQLLINYPIAAEACFPNDMPLAHPAPYLAWDRAGLIAFNLAALAVGVVAAMIALALRRRSRPSIGPNGEPLEIARGRSQFMAACAVFASFGFIAAILFNTVAAIGVPQCSG